jgi:membrane-associated protein
MLLQVIDFILHINVHLQELFTQHGVWWLYGILFVIVFCETGLVVTPFLPGDSLLFAAGALAAMEGTSISVPILVLVLLSAAILGDATNYAIGSRFGHILIRRGDSRFFKKAHLDKAHAFYENYGGKAIIIARFVPIVRTFAPFVAGMSRMTYSKFALYNVVGAVLWVAICAGGGYLFGNIPVVQKNFSFVALGIIILSVLPIVYEALAARRKK